MIYINLYNLHFYLLIYVLYISCAAHRSAVRELTLHKNCSIIIEEANERLVQAWDIRGLFCLFLGICGGSNVLYVVLRHTHQRAELSPFLSTVLRLGFFCAFSGVVSRCRSNVEPPQTNSTITPLCRELPSDLTSVRIVSLCGFNCNHCMCGAS